MNEIENVKPWYQSSGVWGALLAVFSPGIAAVAHLTITQGDIVAMADNLAQLGTTVGAVVALIGRIKATHVIK